MKPTISIPQHWGYPRFTLEQRTEQGTILGLYYYPFGTELAEQFDEGWRYVFVTVVEKIISEAHIDIPDGLNQSAIKQHIVDRYNTGEMVTDMNIFQVDFESINAVLGALQRKEVYKSLLDRTFKRHRHPDIVSCHRS
jgi:hypothetical protein